MRRAAIALAVIVVLAGCTDPPTTSTLSPSAAAIRPLPANIAANPGPGAPAAVIAPHTPRGELELGIERNYMLGHCGLGSPIDIDGSLWDPIGGHDGVGGPLSEEQVGELINATPTIIVLIAPDRLEMRTPRGAVITLRRHAGPRAYFLCD